MGSSILKAFARVPVIPSNKSGFKQIIHLTISQNHLTHIRLLSFLCLQTVFSFYNKFHPRRYHISTWKRAPSVAPTKFKLLQTVRGRGNAARGNQGTSISLWEADWIPPPHSHQEVWWHRYAMLLPLCEEAHKECMSKNIFFVPKHWSSVHFSSSVRLCWFPRVFLYVFSDPVFQASFTSKN